MYQQMGGLSDDIRKALEPTLNQYMAVAKKEATSALIMQALLYTGITFVMLDLMTRRLKKRG